MVVSYCRTDSVVAVNAHLPMLCPGGECSSVLRVPAGHGYRHHYR